MPGDDARRRLKVTRPDAVFRSFLEQVKQGATLAQFSAALLATSRTSASSPPLRSSCSTPSWNCRQPSKAHPASISSAGGDNSPRSLKVGRNARVARAVAAGTSSVRASQSAHCDTGGCLAYCRAMRSGTVPRSPFPSLAPAIHQRTPAPVSGCTASPIVSASRRSIRTAPTFAGRHGYGPPLHSLLNSDRLCMIVSRRMA